MRLWLVAVHIILVGCSVWAGRVYEEANILEDNEFAEFEQFDAEDDLVNSNENTQDSGDSNTGKTQPQQNQFMSVDELDDMIVEDEDNEFEHFQDPEEFEGFSDSAQRLDQPKITIKQMPILVRSQWDAYWMEFLLCCGVAAYALSWAIGKGRNTAIAMTFSKLHRPFLEENFTLVGEPVPSDGAEGSGGVGGWRREADHFFTMWCSGRTCCEGMLLTLKLIKRQDLVNLLAGVVKPTLDTLQIKVDMAKEDSDSFVMCVAQKKTAAKLAKEMTDLSTYCPERRPGEKLGLPSSLNVLSELAEATGGVLDARVTAAINKYAHLIDYIHISDQYSGVKQPDETTPATKPPDTQRVLILGLILPCKTEGTEAGCEAISPLLILTFYLMEKLKRFKLSKEASAKSEKHRREVAEQWQKGAHAARAEQAALKREEKRKQEKERIMAEDDPEKQRRWEKKEQKRQLKRKNPKMKQLKVKAL